MLAISVSKGRVDLSTITFFMFHSYILLLGYCKINDYKLDELIKYNFPMLEQLDLCTFFKSQGQIKSQAKG
jgi:hypothetical protein